MRYIFYGQHRVKEYNPYICDYYGAKVPTLGEWSRIEGYEEFFRKDNVHGQVKAGTRLNINGESVYIRSIEYDIMDDSYKCYTEKILSEKDGNMSKQQAEQKLEEIRNKGLYGFVNRLFGGR